MKTKAEREADLRAAIIAVCAEHGAELTVTEDSGGWGMQCGVLRVSMISVYDGDELVADFCEFDW